MFTNRTIKLVILPHTSFCPYIGTKRFFTQRPRPAETAVSCIEKISFEKNHANPREYHHTGK
jgi:hypothetical protein